MLLEYDAILHLYETLFHLKLFSNLVVGIATFHENTLANFICRKEWHHCPNKEGVIFLYTYLELPTGKRLSHSSYYTAILHVYFKELSVGQWKSEGRKELGWEGEGVGAVARCQDGVLIYNALNVL